MRGAGNCSKQAARRRSVSGFFYRCRLRSFESPFSLSFTDSLSHSSSVPLFLLRVHFYFVWVYAMGADISTLTPHNRATAIAAANAFSDEFGFPSADSAAAAVPVRVRPPPRGLPPDRCAYDEPIALATDDTDEKFGRDRATYDHRIDAHAIRPRLLLGDASAAMDPHAVHGARGFRNNQTNILLL